MSESDVLSARPRGGAHIFANLKENSIFDCDLRRMKDLMYVHCGQDFRGSVCFQGRESGVGRDLRSINVSYNDQTGSRDRDVVFGLCDPRLWSFHQEGQNV